uniref:Modification methylase EcoRI n=1 Tax=uncultured bacterium contig00092 TaxID=1181563 RepID=A0A806K2J5_9BACT|nr:modification methylase EcoRI [uncultured bacterium contig00092]
MATKLFDKAKKNKADEFYTQLADIEAEMHHYSEQFRGKVIFCNCDDPYESNYNEY